MFLFSEMGKSGNAGPINKGGAVEGFSQCSGQGAWCCLWRVEVEQVHEEGHVWVRVDLSERVRVHECLGVRVLEVVWVMRFEND